MLKGQAEHREADFLSVSVKLGMEMKEISPSSRRPDATGPLKSASHVRLVLMVEERRRQGLIKQ